MELDLVNSTIPIEDIELNVKHEQKTGDDDEKIATQ